jgi:CheY-like chemotaxis protein
VALPAAVEALIANNPTRLGLTETIASLDGIRVLIVEDDADAREILARSVQEFGGEASTVGSVQAALEFLGQQAMGAMPHVVVTDLGMPEQDGFMLLSRMRALPHDAGGEIPVIAVTAYATATDRQRALDAGFRMHVEKPVMPLALASAIARAISGVS